MNQYKKFQKLRKKLSKRNKKALDSLVFFLRTAMITEMARLMTEKYSRFTDEHGFSDYYETAMEICDNVLLTNDSVFIEYSKLRFLVEEDTTDYFIIKFDKCMDWYFMDLATKELKQQFLGWDEDFNNIHLRS